MKKIFLVIIALVVLLLLGCGSEEVTTETPATETATETTVTIETPAEETPATTEETVEETTTEETAVEESTETEVVAEETTEIAATYEGASQAGCEDSDGGKNYELAGSIVDARGVTDYDRCSENENFPGKLYESYCKENGDHGRETYDCPSDSCKAGACVAVETTE